MAASGYVDGGGGKAIPHRTVVGVDDCCAGRVVRGVIPSMRGQVGVADLVAGGILSAVDSH